MTPQANDVVPGSRWAMARCGNSADIVVETVVVVIASITPAGADIERVITVGSDGYENRRTWAEFCQHSVFKQPEKNVGCAPRTV